MELTFIDHYDSFSFNVIDWLSQHPGVTGIDVLTCDQRINLKQWKPKDSSGFLVISPGPKSPAAYKSTINLLNHSFGVVPILGICLGHQMIGNALGAKISRSHFPLHGSIKDVNIIDHRGVFKNSRSFKAAVYNSLTITGLSATMVDMGFVVSARDEFGEIQAIEVLRSDFPPTLGLQFHPESFMSEAGELILNNFIAQVSTWRQKYSSVG